jgi:coenzyme F420-0:L-glutamate ligase/coenzyme F420-1:gamma-L-glutamate ligase
MKVELVGIEGLPEFEPGADVAGCVVEAVKNAGLRFERGDVVVITQKIVSKAEGRLVRLEEVVPSPFAVEWGRSHRCDPRLVELILRESRRIVRMDRGVLITETHQGFICANAGVDLSNVSGGDVAALLPRDPDGSARRIREGLVTRTGVEIAVIISDTFGRPWREGLTNVAIGVAGLRPLASYIGVRDPAGLVLQGTVLAIADEIASASGLVGRKLNRVPAIIVRGLSYEAGEGEARELIRPAERDLFR